MSKQLIVLITGANRGLGLALTQAYLERGERVAATCRHLGKATELHRLKETYRDDLIILRADVGLGRSVYAAAEDTAQHLARVDVLINNAGIAPGKRDEPLETVELAQVRDALETNALGPLRTVRAFLPLLLKSQQPRVINVSSGAGSHRPQRPGRAELRLFRLQGRAEHVHPHHGPGVPPARVCIVAMTPGWVRTDMGGEKAELDAATVAGEMVGSIDALTMEQSSLWLDRHGAVSGYSW